MPEQNQPTNFSDYRCGYAALIGEPNVGKSTLMNAALGTKLSIVTPKPQTTRRKVLGFYHTETAQCIFIDTPGLIDPKYALQRSMMDAARSAIAEADVLVLLLDVNSALSADQPYTPELSGFFETARLPLVCLLNKCDLLGDKNTMLPVIERLAATGLFKDIHPISAMTGEGVEDALKNICGALPVHPPLFPPDVLSDQPERFFVSEIIREKIFFLYRQEIPYATEVAIVEFKEKENIDVISAEIIVERESQRRILIGHKGEAIKKVGTLARKDIESFLGRKVFLELHVKVREGWRNSEDWIRRLGYSIQT